MQPDTFNAIVQAELARVFEAGSTTWFYPDRRPAKLRDRKPSDVSLARFLLAELEERFGPIVLDGGRLQAANGKHGTPDDRTIRQIVQGFDGMISWNGDVLRLNRQRIEDVISVARDMAPEAPVKMLRVP